MKKLFFRCMDGDDDADYGFDVDVFEGHFIVSYRFSFLWTGFSEEPVDRPRRFRVIYAPEIKPDMVSRIQDELPPHLKDVEEHLFTTFEALMIFLRENMQAKVWARLIEVVIKGYSGALEEAEDFLDVLRIQENDLKSSLIAKNGGIENFLSKTQAIEKDRNSTLRLIGFSDDVCYLIDYDNIEPDPVWYSVSCHCHSINQAVSVLYGIPKVDYEFITAID